MPCWPSTAGAIGSEVVITRDPNNSTMWSVAMTSEREPSLVLGPGTSDPANYLGGSHRSTSLGDSFTYVLSFGSAAAWVTTTGPNQGSAKIYLDGVYAKTVSTYSKTTHLRREPR